MIHQPDISVSGVLTYHPGDRSICLSVYLPTDLATYHLLSIRPSITSLSPNHGKPFPSFRLLGTCAVHSTCSGIPARCQSRDLRGAGTCVELRPAWSWQLCHCPGGGSRTVPPRVGLGVPRTWTWRWGSKRGGDGAARTHLARHGRGHREHQQERQQERGRSLRGLGAHGGRHLGVPACPGTHRLSSHHVP
jgi:hypothetical protein